MPYAVRLQPGAQRALDRLSERDHRAVGQALARLAEDPRPRGARKLPSRAPTWRVRVRDLRVIYTVFDRDQLVIVLAIERRSERTYRDVNQLFR